MTLFAMRNRVIRKKTSERQHPKNTMRNRKSVLIALVLTALAVPMPSMHAQTFKPLHQFNGATAADGTLPHGALLQDVAGNLYGTTLDGGNGDGTIFRIDSAGKETTLFAFQSPVSGSSPDSALILDQAGNLYGVAEEGPRGGGVVYKLSPRGEQTILYAFSRGSIHSPVVPAGGLFMDKAGSLFGTTVSGGIATCIGGCGTIFRLDPTGKLHVVYEFTGASDGSLPFGPLVQDGRGNLYGVARTGGDLSCSDPLFPGSGCGTVFKLAKNRKLFTLHIFRGGFNGSIPQGGLTLDSRGSLYGTTLAGGRREHGTAFTISKSGAFTTLHRFAKKEGTAPNGSLVLDSAGNLYGTAQFNGRHNLGTVFQLNPFGQLTVLHSFKGSLDGAVPAAGLIRDSAGHLFGTTTRNLSIEGVPGGNVFEITP